MTNEHSMGEQDIVVVSIPQRELKQLRQDAARWRYVRSHLVQALSLHMDGTCNWRFLSPYIRGLSIEEVIDKLIAAEREQPQEGEQ